MKIYPNNSLSFGWNIRTHEYIVKKAVQDNQYGLTSDEIKLLAKYAQEPDLIKAELADMGSGHFYDALHEDPSFGTLNDELNNAMSRFLNHNAKTKTAIKNNDRKGFLKAIGYASHYLQDASTPPHTEHGNYLQKLFRLPMHIQFERGKHLGASNRLDIIDANFKSEELPFSTLKMLFHNTALFTVQPENHVCYSNKNKWSEIQQRCVNRGINATKAYFDYILKYIQKK